jgi:hypothetical protein
MKSRDRCRKRARTVRTAVATITSPSPASAEGAKGKVPVTRLPPKRRDAAHGSGYGEAFAAFERARQSLDWL